MRYAKSALLFLSLILFVAPLASAQAELPTPTPADIFVRGVQFITGDLSLPGLAPEVFTKLMLIILLSVLLTNPAKKILFGGENEKAALLIALIVSVLGVRFIEPSMISSILLQYGVLAITLSVFIPLILAFYFIEDIEFSVARKFGWAIMFVAYLGLYSMRQGDLGWGALYAYLGGALIALGLLFFDGTVNYWMIRWKSKQGYEISAREKLAEVRFERYDWQDRLFRAKTKEDRKLVEEQISRLRDLEERLEKQAAGKGSSWSGWAD